MFGVSGDCFLLMRMCFTCTCIHFHWRPAKSPARCVSLPHSAPFSCTPEILQQGSYKKQDLKIKDFSRTFQHLKILFQDHFIFNESALNMAMQKWVLRKQDTL